MKALVCHVITRLMVGGAQEVMCSIVEGLREEFKQVIVYGTEDAGHERIAARLSSAGATLMKCEGLQREVRPLTDLRGTVNLFRIISGLAPAIVHLHTYKACIVGAIAAKFAAAPRIIMCPHGNIFENPSVIPGIPRARWKMALLRAATNSCVPLATRVVSISLQDRKSQISSRVSCMCHNVVIQNGIACPVPVSRSGSAMFTVGVMGRLSREKGIDIALRGFQKFAWSRADARMLICGEGEELPVLKRLASELGIDARVSFAGILLPNEFYSKVDVLLHTPSFEALGMVVPEALMYGVPVVATGVGGILDSTENGRLAFLVRPDADEISAALARVAAGGPEVEEKIRLGKIQAMREYSISRMIESYRKLYASLLYV